MTNKLHWHVWSSTHSLTPRDLDDSTRAAMEEETAHSLAVDVASTQKTLQHLLAKKETIEKLSSNNEADVVRLQLEAWLISLNSHLCL
jgi:hypothetical protein